MQFSHTRAISKFSSFFSQRHLAPIECTGAKQIIEDKIHLYANFIVIFFHLNPLVFVIKLVCVCDHNMNETFFLTFQLRLLNCSPKNYELEPFEAISP
jgi:hypothetical protein